MEILGITIRGETYHVNKQGFIKRLDTEGFQFSDTWIFLGVSKHHWRRGVDHNLHDGFADPKCLIGGLVWDMDHGTVRRWGGSYCGKLPRITSAHVFKS